MNIDHQRGILEQYSKEVGTAFYRTVMGDGAPVIHYGIYECPSTLMRDATLNATRQLLEIARQKINGVPIEQIIDLGSGPGGSAHFLAQTTGATITCADLCPHHNQENETIAAALGLADHIHTWTGCFEKLPDDWCRKFDLAWSQEALCHAVDKAAVLSQIHRILRPGGVFVFSDILLSETADDYDAKVFSKVNAVTKWSTASDHLRDLNEAGFDEIKHIDWTTHLNMNFHKMRVKIDENRERLLSEGVPNDLLEKFSLSLDQRIAWPPGSVLEWGVFVAKIRQ